VTVGIGDRLADVLAQCSPHDRAEGSLFLHCALLHRVAQRLRYPNSDGWAN